MAPQQLSPFLAPGPVSKLQSLASLHLRRDQVLSTILTEHDETEAGYREGPVINTRFGSFPHSTLVGLPWGCQVRASVVDTGSRGRTGQDRKRKRKDETSGESSSEDGGDNPEAIKTPLTASSGFIHLLSPTPESWTTSLPHRTQVVYTPDYSFILHRLRARPGSVLIEAGSGSGSFTHAAARAIYNGYPESIAASQMGNGGLQKRLGKVWSYEFHQQRAEKIQKEIRDHQLEGVVEIVHRDVYQDGFSIAKRAEDHRSSPGADAVFLDVPAPWLALRHLKRTATAKKSVEVEDLTGAQTMSSEAGPAVTADLDVINVSNDLKLESPLNPDVSVTLCTFSPCIEQVQRTVATLREMGWIDIEMVTVAHKRIEVRRERYGVQEAGQRGANASAANVMQALERLREIEGQERHSQPQQEVNNLNDPKDCCNSSAEKDLVKQSNEYQKSVKRKLYKEGRLVHRAEPELKTHTSYLVFALLPREWTAEDEERAQRRWPLSSKSQVNILADSAKKGRATKVRNGVVQDNGREDGAPPKNRINGRTTTFLT